VCAASPLPQAQAEADGVVSFACALPPGWALGAAAGQQQILAVCLQPLQGGGDGAGPGWAGLAARGCLLTVPAGCQVADLALYKGQRLALLSTEHSSGERRAVGGGPCGCADSLPVRVYGK
jgi:hypothetical protein